MDRIAAWSGGHHDLDVAWPTSGPTRVYDLAVRLEPGMPRHPYHPPFGFALAKSHGEGMYPDGVSSAMEVLVTGGHVGTHVDALGHIAQHGLIYGGREIDQSVTEGLGAGSVEELPPLIGTGHLVDAETIFGRALTSADGINAEHLAAWFAGRREPGPGEVVMVRTGWIRHWPNFNDYQGIATGVPGVTLDGAQWLSEREVLAVGADTHMFEHKPSVTQVALRVHVHLLVETGIPILESVNLEPLVADGVHDFLFIATPLRVKGGTGSPLRPVAVVSRAS
ncbi:MAG: cyclase family protein [Sporichthyaceae bacterium]